MNVVFSACVCCSDPFCFYMLTAEQMLMAITKSFNISWKKFFLIRLFSYLNKYILKYWGYSSCKGVISLFMNFVITFSTDYCSNVLAPFNVYIWYDLFTVPHTASFCDWSFCCVTPNNAKSLALLRSFNCAPKLESTGHALHDRIVLTVSLYYAVQLSRSVCSYGSPLVYSSSFLSFFMHL